MQVFLRSPKGIKYMVKPCSSGLDYEVFRENENFGKPKAKGKNQGEVDDEEWKSCGKYSSELWWALTLAIQDMMRDDEDGVVIKAGRGTLEKQLEGIKNCIETYVKKIQIKEEK